MGHVVRLQVFALGVLFGALLTYVAVQAAILPSGARRPSAVQTVPSIPTVVTATALPTPTDTPSPTPTDVPSPTATATAAVEPPTTAEIVELAQDYIDHQSDYAGSYVMMDDPQVQVRSLDATQLTACIQFNVATIGAPRSAVGTDTRLFTLTTASEGDWYVAALGDANSCSLN